MKIKYNAPVTLTFSLIAFAVFGISNYVLPLSGSTYPLTEEFFTVPSSVSFQPSNPRHYLLLVTHIFGHAGWAHLLGNLSYILILGPLLESVYGPLNLALMILVTGFATGVINVCFFTSPLLGASGVVFMMVLLSSFTNRKKKEIPLTFILVVILFLGREIAAAFEYNSVSQFAHLAGGLCGSLFGFFAAPVSVRQKKTAAASARSADRTPRTAEKENGPVYDPAAPGNRVRPVQPASRPVQPAREAPKTKESTGKPDIFRLFRRKTGVPEVDQALSEFESRDSFRD